MQPVTLRWLACGASALLLHVVVLAWTRGAWQEAPPVAHATPPEPVQIRQIDAAEPAKPQRDARTKAGVPRHTVAPSPGLAAAPELAPMRTTAPQRAHAPESSPPDDPADEATAPADDGPHYFARSALDRPPVVLSAVLLTYPEFPGDAGHYTVVLALFIDEDGRVRRINIEEPGLPEVLEGVARRAFLDAHFQPAERAGRPVPSRIRVEVTFETSPAR